MVPNFFRIYRSLSEGEEYLGRISVSLVDRPGSLAALANIFARFGINISLFHYDRAEHSNRVLLDVTSESLEALKRVGKELTLSFPPVQKRETASSELGIMDRKNILKIEVSLENRPGTLGAFAHILSLHSANVIFMSYNEDISISSAAIALYTEDPEELDLLLKEMNEEGYDYSLIFRGAENREIEDVIGLNLTERFFFKLKSILHTEDISRLKKVIDSSRQISDSLLKFSNEAGKHIEEGNVTTSVLAFATASQMSTGEKFSYTRLPNLTVGETTLHAFRLPTGGNIILLEKGVELVMIDGGYGIFYDDVKAMLRSNGLDPLLIHRIYLTHADADHAGMSGAFSAEFGSAVFLHPKALKTIRHENRAWGSDSPLLDLNRYFTVLVNEFTAARYPDSFQGYSGDSSLNAGGFQSVGSFELSGDTYHVVEGKGGHVPGQVFIFSYDTGLVFTSDYLLHVESLDATERDILNYPKFMMTSTNVNSSLFREEMELLRSFVLDLDERMQERGLEAVIVPGHGDYYPVRILS